MIKTVDHAPIMHRTVSQSGGAQPTRERTWGIAVEAPVEIALNGAPYTVMLATPANVEDLAVGVVLTERVLSNASAVQDIIVSEFLHDISVNVIVSADALDSKAVRSRSLLSSTACGLCGLESLAELEKQMSANGARSNVASEVTDAAILTAFAELPQHQPMNGVTHSVHAASWCTPDGEIVMAREDVGRHNALDKLVGAMARQGMLHDDGFIVMSSRCSYELVYKASLTACRLLATISAPTSMALEWSQALTLPLACAAGGQVVRFPNTSTHAV